MPQSKKQKNFNRRIRTLEKEFGISKSEAKNIYNTVENRLPTAKQTSRRVMFRVRKELKTKAFVEREEVEVPTEIPTGKKKWTVHLKVIYDSPRGNSHDFFIEARLLVVAEKELTPDEIVSIVRDKISTGNFNTGSNAQKFKDFWDNIHESLAYDDMEVGIESAEDTNEDELQELEVFAIGYKL